MLLATGFSRFRASERPAHDRRVQGGPAGPSHVIGCADPGPGDRSLGFVGDEDDGQDQGEALLPDPRSKPGILRPSQPRRRP